MFLQLVSRRLFRKKKGGREKKKRNKKSRYLSNPWNSNIYQYPSHDPLVKTCIHKYLCERRRSISKQSFFNRIFPIEGRNRIYIGQESLVYTPRFSRSTAASWLLKRNRAALHGQYNFFLYSLSLFQYMLGRCYRFTVIRWPCVSGKGWERKDRFSSSFEGAAVNLVQGSSNATIRSLILRQCVGNGKGGQRRSLSRRVLPWHHETSTLLLNLSLPRHLLSRLLLLPRGGEMPSLRVHTAVGNYNFSLQICRNHSWNADRSSSPLARSKLLELPIY